MLITLNDISLIYEKIIEELNIDYISVVIYTALDIDSLCTLKIISKFFKGQNIQFKTYPCLNYTDLQKRIEESKIYTSIKLFMFINCGGCIDLTEKWFIENNQNTKIFIFDANKPLNHKNIESSAIYILDDEHSQLDNRFTGKELQELNKLNELDYDQIQIQQSDEENNIVRGQNSPIRRRRTHFVQRLQKQRYILEKKYYNYYEQSFYSLPSSYCIYILIKSLNKANNFSLWYGIVGMTAMYLENQISPEVLNKLTDVYRSDMIKFNPQNNQKREKGQIFRTIGLKFPLMNHWSLYQSMLNSPYLMVKLNLWNDKGITKMHQILTKIGISLNQAKQLYKYMSKESKTSLEQNIYVIAEFYDLLDVTYESFMNQVDTSCAYTASDFYYLLAGILEKPLHKSTVQQLNNHRINCFWDAYTILEGSQQMIKKAVEQEKQILQLMMKEAKDIIEREHIISLSRVNFSNIRCDTKQKRLFENTSNLIRFSYILMGIQKSRKNQKKDMLFITSLHDVQKQICTFVGINDKYKNKMAMIFNEVAQQLKISVKHDYFMSNVMTIPKESMLEFIKKIDSVVGKYYKE